MIDVHCHLEQKDFDKDREELIEICKTHLKAIITCCAHPKDFDLTINLAKKFKGFLFATVSLHPEYVNELEKIDLDSYFDRIKREKDLIVGIGETGLDYYWIKDEKLREKQKELFKKHIELARELNLPLVIHARDAFEDCIEILEEFGCKEVLMHMFGARNLLDRVIKNGWYISVNTMILKSKNYRKIAKKCPLDFIMTETDSPWLGFGKRNDPLAIKKVVEKIAEIKKIPVEEVDRVTTKNAIEFFNLNLKP